MRADDILGAAMEKMPVGGTWGFLKKVIRKPYYHVPPCPVCGSVRTGRLIRAGRKVDTNWAILSSLKNGEIVRPMRQLPQGKDAFCSECGHCWGEGITLSFRTLEQIEEERAARGTHILLEEEAKRQEEEAARDSGILRAVERFTGIP